MYKSLVPGSSTDDPPFWKSSRRRPWGRGWGIRYFFPVYKSGISRYMRGQYSWLRPGPHVSGYFWIRNFSFRLRLPSTRIRWIRQRIRIFLNKCATNPITSGRVNPDIFESDDVANSCPVSYRSINRYDRALYGACSEHILLQSSPGYYSESGYHRMRVDWRIRFEYATCRRGNFWIPKEKVADSKISRYVWTRPKKIWGNMLALCECFWKHVSLFYWNWQT